MNKESSLVHLVLIRVIAITAVAMLASFLAFSVLGARSGYDALEVKMEWTLQQLQSALSVPLWNLDIDAARTLLEKTLVDEDLHYISVESSDGLFPSLVLGDPDRPAAFSRLGSVVHGGTPLASLEITGNTDRIKREFTLNMAGFGLILVLLEAILSLSLYFILWRTVLKPLLRVESFALSVLASQREPKDESAVRNEIVLLDSAVRSMVNRLEFRLDELERSRGEKNILIDELNHRVRNNLSIIYGLLDLQRSRFEDPEVDSMIRAMQSRIHALSVLHQHLLGTKDLRRIDLRAYLDEVADWLYDSLVGRMRPVPIRVLRAIENLDLDIDTAQACGLVVTELLSNAFTHAFPDSRTGTVSLMVQRRNSILVVQVEDDGIGIRPGRASSGGTGMLMVESLVPQLKGSLTIEAVEPAGTRFRIEIPIGEKERSHEGRADR